MGKPTAHNGRHLGINNSASNSAANGNGRMRLAGRSVAVVSRAGSDLMAHPVQCKIGCRDECMGGGLMVIGWLARLQPNWSRHLYACRSGLIGRRRVLYVSTRGVGVTAITPNL